jgi:hypothetical protein
MSKLLEIQNRIQGDFGTIMQPHRRLIRECPPVLGYPCPRGWLLVARGCTWPLVANAFGGAPIGPRARNGSGQPLDCCVIVPSHPGEGVLPKLSTGLLSGTNMRRVFVFNDILLWTTNSVSCPLSRRWYRLHLNGSPIGFRSFSFPFSDRSSMPSLVTMVPGRVLTSWLCFSDEVPRARRPEQVHRQRVERQEAHRCGFTRFALRACLNLLLDIVVARSYCASVSRCAGFEIKTDKSMVLLCNTPAEQKEW